MSEARAEPPVDPRPARRVTRGAPRELYRLMALVRALDEEATALQRQGELAVYPQLVGQEAAQVGQRCRPGAPTTGSFPRTASSAWRWSAASTWSSTSPSTGRPGTAGCRTRCGTGSRW